MIESTKSGVFAGVLLMACLIPVAGAAESTTGLHIAGTDPSQRPDGAPTITQTEKDAAWYQRSLRGVEAPYPYSLRFLEDQGNWFNPFRKPGMTGPYDIRGWH